MINNLSKDVMPTTVNININNIHGCNHVTERHLICLPEILKRLCFVSLDTFNQCERLHSLLCGYQRLKHLRYQKTTNSRDKSLLMGVYLISLFALYCLITLGDPTRPSAAANACHTVTEWWSVRLCFICQLFTSHVCKQRHVPQRSALEQVSTWNCGSNVSPGRGGVKKTFQHPSMML